MNAEKKFKGVIVPMITPFTFDGKIDLDATDRIVEHLVRNKTHPFVLGTTGESASIPDSLRPAFVERMVKTVDGRSVTFAGIASNCQQNSIDLARRYFDLGVNAVVAHLPHYYPMAEDAMLRYFESLADAIPGPLILYNIPARTNLSLPLSVIDELSHHENIWGLKDSQRNLERLEAAIGLWRERKDFSYLIGWAAQSTRGLTLGADGIVPSTGNVVPNLYQRLYQATLHNDLETARQLQALTDDISSIYQKDRILSEALAALKVIMHQLGFCEKVVLPPLYALNEDEEKTIVNEMERIKLREILYERD